MAAVRFPSECRLAESEREVLRGFLSEKELPCDGCAWKIECSGPASQLAKEDEFLKDPNHKCFICGSETGKVGNSRLISGTFRFCSEKVDEYVFNPLEKTEATPSAPEEINF